MDLEQWLNARGGIAPRVAARDAGFGDRALRAFTLRRGWLVTDRADPQLRVAAELGARLACVSAAQHRGIALLTAPTRLQLAVPRTARIRRDPERRFHTSAPLARSRELLVESVPDMLEHVAGCLPAPAAFAVWESALRTGRIGRHELGRIPWRHVASRRLAARASAKSDSLLESLLAWELHELGLGFEQQVRLAGHRVDFLVEGRLVVQTDGWAFHGGAAQRREDLEHDARLMLDGVPVLRRDYVQIVHELPATVELLLRRLAMR